MLLERLRAVGREGTKLARATAGTIRLRLLKVAAQVSVSVRRVHVRFSRAYPLQSLFASSRERHWWLPISFRVCIAQSASLNPMEG